MKKIFEQFIRMTLLSSLLVILLSSYSESLLIAQAQPEGQTSRFIILVEQNNAASVEPTADTDNVRFEVVQDVIRYLWEYQDSFLTQSNIEVVVVYFDDDEIRPISFTFPNSSILQLNSLNESLLNIQLNSLNSSQCGNILTPPDCRDSNFSDLSDVARTIINHPDNLYLPHQTSFLWIVSGASGSGCSDAPCIRDNLRTDLSTLNSFGEIDRTNTHFFLTHKIFINDYLNINGVWHEFFPQITHPVATNTEVQSVNVFENRLRTLMMRAVDQQLASRFELSVANVLASNQQAQTIQIPPFTSELRIATAYYLQGNTLILTSPDGTVYSDENNQQGEFITISDPKVGTWTITKSNSVPTIHGGQGWQTASPFINQPDDRIHYIITAANPPVLASPITGVAYYEYEHITSEFSFRTSLINQLPIGSIPQINIVPSCEGCSFIIPDELEVIHDANGYTTYRKIFVPFNSILERPQSMRYSTQLIFTSPDNSFVPKTFNGQAIEVNRILIQPYCRNENPVAPEGYLTYPIPDGIPPISVAFPDGDQEELYWYISIYTQSEGQLLFLNPDYGGNNDIDFNVTINNTSSQGMEILQDGNILRYSNRIAGNSGILSDLDRYVINFNLTLSNGHVVPILNESYTCIFNLAP